jgi:hypothetical protein
VCVCYGFGRVEVEFSRKASAVALSSSRRFVVNFDFRSRSSSALLLSYLSLYSACRSSRYVSHLLPMTCCVGRRWRVEREDEVSGKKTKKKLAVSGGGGQMDSLLLVLCFLSLSLALFDARPRIATTLYTFAIITPSHR